LGLAAAGCSDDEDGEGSPSGAVSLKSAIYVSPIDGATHTRSADSPVPKALGDGLEPEENLSVTPSSYQVEVATLSIGERWEFVPDAGFACMGKVIEIPVDQTLDLAATTFAPVFESTLELTEDQLGQYTCMELQIGGSATVTWETTVNGKTYDYSDPASAQTLNLGWAGRIVALPEGVVLDITDAESTDEDGGVETSNTYTAGLVLDLNDSLLLRRIDGAPPEETIVEDLSPPESPNSDVVIVNSNTPMILPFVGSEEPSVEKYMLSFSETERAKLGLAADDTLAMRFSAVFNAAGELLTVDWTPLYGDSVAGIGLAFEPADPAMVEVTPNSSPAGSYQIDDADDPASGTRDRALHFHAFSLEDHTGTFDYGDDASIVLEYSATKLSN
jgi:hypothetical protein